MSLATRCPSCTTVFRVQPGQLSARAGQVRCGKCNAVFDGITALVDAPPPAITPQAEAEAVPEFLSQPRAPRRGLWAALVVLAAAALMAQIVHHFRSEIAAGWPLARAPLERACAYLGCELRLPRQLRLLSIDSYEVHPDPRREGVIVLNAVIRNRAPFAQAYPALQLTLTDDAQREVVSRWILPHEYLDSARASSLIGRGLAPGGEASLTLHLDTSRARATGYELVLFYPS